VKKHKPGALPDYLSSNLNASNLNASNLNASNLNASNLNASNLNIGKIPNDLLISIIGLDSDDLPYRSELITGPSIGEDCAVLDFGNSWVVATTDPITGSDKNIGVLGLNISLNDLASAGAEPVAILVTLLCPPDTRRDEILEIMASMRSEAKKLGIVIAGGHTEITDAVNRTIVSITALGKTAPGAALSTSGAKVGDSLIMTKSAGLEGTAILASEFEAELQKSMDVKSLKTAQSFINKISVVKEGKLAVEKGVHAMHDATEGGILGGIWELFEASGLGGYVYLDRIPVEPQTNQICNYFDISPYRLISSGCMLMACSNGLEMVDHLKQNGIDATVIGLFDKKERVIIGKDGQENLLEQPGADELYRAMAKKN
jgi:hydrogenase expression/formation protein HypE